MEHIITTYLPWILSVVTFITHVMAGNTHKWTWVVSAGNQVLWMIWIVAVSAWGLAPLTIGLFVLNIRNYFKWKKRFERNSNIIPQS